MPLNERLALGLSIAAVLAYVTTPVAIRVASHFDFVDRPRGYRGHANPTPYLGGAAVCVGFIVAALTVTSDAQRTLAIVVAMAILWALGTLDDRREVSPAIRVAVELLISIGLWAVGLGWQLGLGGAVDAAATALWIIAVTNAFNLFDNMDGASSSMACVASGAVAVFGAVRGDAWLAATGAALAGSCLGFLPHNVARPSARIFLGDGGSMPVGFGVSALVMVGTSDALAAWQSLAIGLLLIGIPALDTTLVVISRRRKGISVLTGGRDHLTHRTRRRLKDARVVAVALGGVQAVISAFALVAVAGGSIAIVAVVVCYLAAAGTAIAMLEADERRQVSVAELVAAPAPGSRRRVSPAVVFIVVIGLGASLSSFAAGYYDATVWVPIGAGVIATSSALLIAGGVKLSRAGALAVMGLAGLGAWQLLSSTWAESVHQAFVDGDRTLVLAGTLGLGLLIVRDDRKALWLIGAVGIGTLVVAADVAVRMAGGGPLDLFIGGRLNEPLGYINAMGTAFLIGAWGCLAAAERRQPVVAGLGMGCAVGLMGLGVLTESRGAALAALASLVLVLTLAPGRRRRLCALVIAAGGVGIALRPLLDVYDALVAHASGAHSVAVVHHAAWMLVLGAAIAALAWGTITAVARHWEADQVATRRLNRISTSGLAVVGLAVVAIAAINTGSLVSRVGDQYDAFVHLSTEAAASSPDAAQTRLVSGGGNRYDYWRIGLNDFLHHPVAGVGAGNYDVTYFRDRRTDEDIRQAHSMEIQALGETGVVGFALLLLFAAGLVVGALRTARIARHDAMARTVLVASLGATSAWLVHTSVDWMHLIPGVTAMALFNAATLIRRREPAPQPGRVPVRAIDRLGTVRVRRVAGAAVLGLLVLVTGASLVRQGLNAYYRGRASAALADDPARALTQANRALRLDGDDVGAYYLKASALARYNQADAAQRTLRTALAREPHDFVTWALLGDLAQRRGRLREARFDYQKAHTLNPREPSLSKSLAELSRPEP